jgi:hypothetical protein
MYKHLTKKVSESAGTILARAMTGDATKNEIGAVRDELDEDGKLILDAATKIIFEQIGIKEELQKDPLGILD